LVIVHFIITHAPFTVLPLSYPRAQVVYSGHPVTVALG